MQPKCEKNIFRALSGEAGGGGGAILSNRSKKVGKNCLAPMSKFAYSLTGAITLYPVVVVYIWGGNCQPPRKHDSWNASSRQCSDLPRLKHRSKSSA